LDKGCLSIRPTCGVATEMLQCKGPPSLLRLPPIATQSHRQIAPCTSLLACYRITALPTYILHLHLPIHRVLHRGRIGLLLPSLLKVRQVQLRRLGSPFVIDRVADGWSIAKPQASRPNAKPIPFHSVDDGSLDVKIELRKVGIGRRRSRLGPLLYSDRYEIGSRVLRIRSRSKLQEYCRGPRIRSGGDSTSRSLSFRFARDHCQRLG
jgi:hypothetical protein